jgi:hypothetical protein
MHEFVLVLKPSIILCELEAIPVYCIICGVFREMLQVRANDTVGKAGSKLLWFVDLLSAKCI